MGRGSQSRVWDFVINNPTVSGRELFDLLQGKVQYFQFQLEKGEETGTLHFQGYVILRTRSYLSAMLKLFGGNKASCRPLRTDTQVLDDYTSKDDGTRAPGSEVFFDGVWEFITINGGARQEKGNLKRLLESVIEQKQTLKEAFSDSKDTLTRNYKGIQLVVGLYNKGRPRLGWPVKNILFYGEPGAGKSDWAMFYHHEMEEFRYAPSGKEPWFDGYMQEYKAIFDDFKGGFSHWTRELWCRVADKNRVNLPVKGGFCSWNTKLQCWTTNIHPRQWWTSKEANEATFYEVERRFEGGFVLAFRSKKSNPYVIRPGTEAWKSFWKGPGYNPGTLTQVVTMDACANPALGLMGMCDCVYCRQHTRGVSGVVVRTVVPDVSTNPWTFWEHHDECRQLNYEHALAIASEIDEQKEAGTLEKQVVQTAEEKAHQLKKEDLEKKMNSPETHARKRARDPAPAEGEPPPKRRRELSVDEPSDSYAHESMFDFSYTQSSHGRRYWQ